MRRLPNVVEVSTDLRNFDLRRPGVAATGPGRWGPGLTIAKMKDCRWLNPVSVGQFEFTEWTPDDYLRHSRFVALRDDKKARDLVRGS